jgi:putative transposase
MPNHIHLLIRITNGNELPRLLQSINQGYARYYKNSYGLVGNLFQGRYKGMLIERDEYLLECARYIERNPLRAGMVNDPSSYHWSSCKYYTKGKIDDIITSNFLYETLSSDRDERARLYEQYLLQERPYEKLVDRTLRF